MVAALAAYGAWEKRRHLRHLARIPLRIHVNGTRGKSSLTRLIAAGCRGGGRRTFAKTTGTMARMIFPDGRETDVYRVGHANIIEQTRIVRRAVEAGAEVLVIECMAVQPDLQPVAELQLVRSHIGVITNARPDHLDVMGPTVDDVAFALAQTCPQKGHLFTAERERAHILRRVAEARGTELHVVTDEGVTSEDLAGFSYFEHAENLALALAVCAHLGVSRADALRGMHTSTPDPGALTRYRIEAGAREVTFVNAFAANDPDSTYLIWQRLGLEQAEPGVQRILLANCRDDRLQRSGQIAEFVTRRVQVDHLVLTGLGTELVAFQAAQRGMPRDRISDLGSRSAEEIFERVLALVEDRAIVVGIGNLVGLGEEIVLHFSNRSVSHG